jgi:hypothetical protein
MKSIQVSETNHTRIMDRKDSKKKSADNVISYLLDLDMEGEI